MNTNTTTNAIQKAKALRWVLILSVFVMLIKFVAYFITLSNAILSDALESIVNIAATAFALFSVQFGSRSKDSDHPYGHGKIEYVATGFEGALIFAAGVFIIIRSVKTLMFNIQINHIEEGMLLSSASAVLLLIMGSFLKRKGKQFDSITLIADGQHMIVDTLTTIGIVAGLFIYKLTGLIWIDSVLGILLAIYILINGFRILKISLDHLMDRADPEIMNRIVNVLEQIKRPQWIDIHNMRIQKFGDLLHVDCHMTLPFYETLDNVHEEITQLERGLNKAFDNRVELFVHTDPCQQIPCRICPVAECKARQHPFEHRIVWTAENLSLNQKHFVHTN